MQKPKKILITGACGYVGSVLLQMLGQELDGYVLRLFDNLSDGNVTALQNLPLDGHYQFIEGDLLDPSQLDYALKGVDTVIHLAAIVNTPLSFDNPNTTRQVNHWGTTHLVNACIENEVEHLIFTSTASVYGPGNNKKEGDVTDPLGAYANSKLEAEHYIRSKKEQLDYTIFRVGTVYGPSPNMRVQSFVNRLCFLAGTKKKLTVYGDGRQVRPVIHIEDLCRLLLHTLKNRDSFKNEVVNTCENNYEVLDVIDAIKKHKADVDVVYTDQDIRTRYNFSVDGGKLSGLGWQPEIDLVDGVKSVISRFVGFEKVGTLDGFKF